MINLKNQLLNRYSFLYAFNIWILSFSILKKNEVLLDKSIILMGFSGDSDAKEYAHSVGHSRWR